jgi:asparagine synthase (glutamine-hydrolysing)
MISRLLLTSFLLELISTGTLNNRMLFKHLRRLPAGSYITLDETGLQQTTYWSGENVREVRYKTPGEYSEHFRALFNQAVAARVRTPYPVGAHNSGGLDSSGVTALANRELRRSGRSLTMTYTWSPAKSDAYPPVKHDERDDIEALCLQEDIPCHYGTATAQDFRDALARDLAVETITPLYEEIPILSHAEGLGIRTILSGWGGDEAATFNGGGYLAQLLRQGRILRLAQITRREVGFRRPFRTLKFLYRRSIIPLLPSALYDRVHPYFRPEQRNRYLHPTFAARFPQVPALQLREVADVRKMQRLWLQHGHLAMRMELWALWSAPHRLVYSYPLTDRRILEFSIGLPPSLLYQQGEWRFLYRQAMNDTLPHNLNWKPNKTDVVNEQKRVENRMGCWQLWADEVRAGHWKEDDVYWLDMDPLRARLTSLPHQMKLAETLEFAGLAAAVRVWHLWHYYPNA